MSKKKFILYFSISFACNAPDLQSGICTPSYRYAKGFQYASLADVLTNKLKSLNSISPKSGEFEFERRSPDNSVINFNCNSKNNSQKKIYHVNIQTNTNNNMNMNINNTNINSPIGSVNSQPPTKMMRVIRGGGGKDYNSTQNTFFSKMLNNGENNNNNLKLNLDRKKINLDKLNKDKFNLEMKMLDGDDLNDSRENEIIGIELEKIESSQRNEKTPQKDKGGIWNMFSKIIK